MNSMNDETVVDLMSKVSDYVSKDAACAASYIRGVQGVDYEVDLMVMLQPLYKLAVDKGLTDVAASLLEAIENAYDAFVNAEFNTITQGDEWSDDVIEWL